MHAWIYINPRRLQPCGVTTELFSVGIIVDNLIKPNVLPSFLDCRKYRIFLEEALQKLLENVPTSLRCSMWFQHDGAPELFAKAVHN